MQITRDVQPRRGVVLVGAHYVDTSKNLQAATADLALARELGLVTVTWGMAGRERRARLLRLVVTRSVDLPAGILPAVVTSLSVHARGSIPAATMAGLAAAVGLLTGFLGVTASGIALAALAASVIVHETGHVVVYRLVAPAEAWGTIVRGAAAGHLVRMPLGARADVLVACGGAGAVVAGTLLFLPLAPASPLVPVLWGAIAGGHALSLLVPVGDGATIRTLSARPTLPLAEGEPDGRN